MAKLTSINIRKTAEDDFEQNLAQMADAEISQSMPSLTPYKVGFQVIDKNDDETRGAGVMVYKFKDQWVYIPAFFLNGRLRGYDEMYLPDKAQMVPSKDNWLSYISSRQPITLGEPQKDDNVKPRKDSDVAFLEGRYNLIRNKRAEDGNTILGRLGLQGLGEFHGWEDNQFDLRKFIPKLGKTATVAFLRTLNTNTDFANAILKYYTPEDIGGIAKHAIDEGAYKLPVATAPSMKEDLVVFTKEDLADAGDKLDESAKEVLMRDGVYVADGRKDTSSVFQPRDVPGSLHSPTANGWYEVLMADGEFKRFYIIIKRGMLSSCRAQEGTAHVYLVPDNDTGHISETDRVLLCRRSDDLDGGLEKFGMTPDSFIRSSRDESANFVLIDKAGIGFPLRSRGKTTVSGDSMIGAYDDNCEDIIMRFTGKNGNVYRTGNTIFVPDSARFVREADYNKRREYIFGDINTIKLTLQKSAGLEPLKIYTDLTDYTISGRFGEEKALTKTAAFLSLVRRHGIDAPTAKMMAGLKPASSGRTASARYLVKYAAPTQDDTMAASAQGFEDAPRSEDVEVINPGINSDDVGKAVKASENGVKDVMDVSVLKALATGSDTGRLVNDIIPDLLLGLDKLGRLLFMFYWHNEDFKERYGNDKMMELEDQLRDSFHGLGDLILFLHKSTVEPSLDLFSGALSENIG